MNIFKILFQECHTRVLKGHIAFDSLIFPTGTKGKQVLKMSKILDVKVSYHIFQ